MENLFDRPSTKIQLIRILLQKTQFEIAVTTGIKPSTLRSLEQGRFFPSPENTEKLTTTLKLNPRWLLEDRGPIFLSTFSFVVLVMGQPKHGIRYHTMISSQFVSDTVNYLIEKESIRESWVVKGQGNSWFILKALVPELHFVVLKTDVFLQEIVLDTFGETAVKVETIEGAAARGPSDILDEFYQSRPTANLLTRLMLSIPVLATSSGAEAVITEKDVLSPMSLGIGNKTARILELVLALEATPEDVEEVLGIVKSRVYDVPQTCGFNRKV
jgi:transcriptional regulator with XRE-family HTH domain